MYINSFNAAIHTQYNNRYFTPVSNSVKMENQPMIYQYRTNGNTNSVNNFWQYQNYYGMNNQIYYNQELINNTQLGYSILNDFKIQFPCLESYTMTDALARKMKKTNPNSLVTIQMKTKSDILFKKMIGLLEKRPDYKSITFDEYLNIVKNEFRNENHGNCGERAYLVYDKLNKLGLKNHTIVEIGGKENYNSHVFNVIGLAPNAIINRPETWGNSAIVIDTWANKCCKPNEALAFYHDFLEYGQDNPMQFKILDVKKIFKQ